MAQLLSLTHQKNRGWEFVEKLMNEEALLARGVQIVGLSCIQSYMTMFYGQMHVFSYKKHVYKKHVAKMKQKLRNI